MKALIYDGVGKCKLVEKDTPQLSGGLDALVKMQRTTICGSDLHILKGDVPTCTPGRTLGHEGIGIIEEIGQEVKNFKEGDRAGWILGNTVDGSQAEYVRIQYADTSLYHVPNGVDDRTLLLFSDILPTGLEVGVLRGKVEPGCTVAIVGAGPVGLAAGLTAQLYAPRKLVFFDMDDYRLSVAQKLGATHVYNVKNMKGTVRDLAAEHIDEADGFDVVMEAVGIPATFNMCEDLVAKGGHIANIGVHGKSVDLHIERLWARSTTISMALVSAHTIPTLLNLFAAGKIDASAMVTHVNPKRLAEFELRASVSSKSPTQPTCISGRTTITATLSRSMSHR
ncbi:GroES-like protein [Stemphylium lycopersici]|uniref:GroES-like protein n=1 Tax=Stemphylium lycopersici TaxID=183478 RepID=A0A364MRR1_STELY|nr:alcohol dehydrogenase [Stemphylium lycopersici]RAQ98693.1 GroES-like protein [Stemphylium lycopersici]RAR01125.1 GroES-like protein [Stemphylium lycopersici]